MWPSSSSCLHCMALGCFTLQRNVAEDHLQLPKLHCLTGRVRWHQPFSCLCAHRYQVAFWELPDVSHSAHPQSPALVSTLNTLHTRTHPAQVQHLASAAGLCGVSWTCAVLSSLPPCPHKATCSTTGFPADPTGLACCDNYSSGGQGRAEGTETVWVTICQEMAREHNPNSTCLVSVQTAPRESPWGQLAPWHPNKGWKQSGYFTLSRAAPAPCRPCLFPRFSHLRREQRVLPGETTGPVSTAQPGGASILETHFWRNEQPNYTDVSAFNYSWSVVQTFPFLSHVRLPKTHKNQQQCRISTLKNNNHTTALL